MRRRSVSQRGDARVLALVPFQLGAGHPEGRQVAVTREQELARAGEGEEQGEGSGGGGDRRRLRGARAPRKEPREPGQRGGLGREGQNGDRERRRAHRQRERGPAQRGRREEAAQAGRRGQRDPRGRRASGATTPPVCARPARIAPAQAAAAGGSASRPTPRSASRARSSGTEIGSRHRRLQRAPQRSGLLPATSGRDAPPAASPAAAAPRPTRARLTGTSPRRRASRRRRGDGGKLRLTAHPRRPVDDPRGERRELHQPPPMAAAGSATATIPSARVQAAPRRGARAGAPGGRPPRGRGRRRAAPQRPARPGKGRPRELAGGGGSAPRRSVPSTPHPPG